MHVTSAPRRVRPAPAIDREAILAYLSLLAVLAVLALALGQSARALLGGAPVEKAVPVLEAPIAELGKWVGAWLTGWIAPELSVPTPLGDVGVRHTLAYAIYEWVKLPIILYLTTFGMTAIRLSLSTERLERTLGRGDALGVLGGIVLGIFTPVCSCTVTNLYAGLLAGGAHRRAAAAFLFASPAMNEFAILFMLVAAGPLGMGLYLLSGAVAAFALAYLCDCVGLNPALVPKVGRACAHASHRAGRASVLVRAQRETLHLVRRLLFAVLLSGALAALLTNFNLTLVAALRQAGGAWWGPLAATALGLPLDVNAASTAPILFALRDVVPLGTLISAMMATTVASIPEGSMLIKLIGLRPTAMLAGFYAAYVASVGLLINALFA